MIKQIKSSHGGLWGMVIGVFLIVVTISLVSCNNSSTPVVNTTVPYADDTHNVTALDLGNTTKDEPRESQNNAIINAAF